MAEQMLFPVFDVPDLVAENEPEQEKYKSSVCWNMEKGDFERDGASRLIVSSGKDTYIQWCYKIVRTERYVHLAYPEYIGTEMVEATAQPANEAVESMLERTISEALLVNPRTEYVRDFEFSWYGDSVFCEFTVKGRDWEELILNTNILLEEVISNDSRIY